ncbi:MAG: hypothetical protein IKA12_03850 [Clostridia bacterium]|nr:hypothetical protein [Clostridia bacterium]
MKKLKLPSEIAYLLAVVLLAFSVAMLSAVDFGLSMIVAPAYVLSQKFTFLTFGQAEYVLQAILFVAFCIIVKKFKPIYLIAFLSCLIYGAVLDLWRIIIPTFNPAITVPGSMDLWLRILFFVLGECITAFSVALFFKVYIFPQVTDFFVMGVTAKFNVKLSKFKTFYDLGFLVVALILSFSFFGKLVGISFGTIILALTNGSIIGFFSKLIDKCFEIKPLFPKFSELFVLP